MMDDSAGCCGCLILVVVAALAIWGFFAVDWSQATQSLENFLNYLWTGLIILGAALLGLFLIIVFGSVLSEQLPPWIARSRERTERQRLEQQIEQAIAEQFVPTPGRKRVYEIWDVGSGYILIPEIAEPGRLTRAELPPESTQVGQVRATDIESARARLRAALGQREKPKKPLFDDLDEPL